MEDVADRACTIYPIRHPDLWEMYQKALGNFWTAGEVDLESDMAHWRALSEDERHFIRMILAFFAGADAIVAQNLTLRFMNDVRIMEAQYFYGFQVAMENIHAETYSKMIEKFIPEPNVKHSIINSLQLIPTIKKKGDWALEYMGLHRPFVVRLVAFAAIEGIFFSGSFCAIFWLKKRGLMPGLCHSNELIARDEGLHTDFACLLYNKFSNSENIAPEAMASSIDEINALIRAAVAIECEFVADALPVRLLGMNSDLMCTYIEFVADHLLVSLGLKKIFNATNPFEWMERISMSGKTNFFERRVSEYQRVVADSCMSTSSAHEFDATTQTARQNNFESTSDLFASTTNIDF